jgi:hypothetical protein
MKCAENFLDYQEAFWWQTKAIESRDYLSWCKIYAGYGEIYEAQYMFDFALFTFNSVLFHLCLNESPDILKAALALVKNKIANEKFGRICT